MLAPIVSPTPTPVLDPSAYPRVAREGRYYAGTVEAREEMTVKDASSVVIDTFPNRSSADVARGVLAAEGIDAKIISDDAGGLHPDLALNRGVDLVVAGRDAEVARSVLGAERGSSGDAYDPDDVAFHGGATRLIAAALSVLVVAIVVISVVRSF